MPKMFGFSRRRIKLGRLKGHLHDPFHGSRSPARPTKRHSHPNEEELVATSVSGRPDDLAWRCSSDTFDLNGRAFENSENWAVLSTEGDKPSPRFDHAAAMVGSKMIVFGGDAGHHLLDDTKILSLDKLTWDSVASKVRASPGGRSPKFRPCKGHCLVPWGKNVILVGGKSEPPSDRITVWTFNSETEIWLHMEAKGDIPVARSGHTVTRAGPVLILFGGEDTKGKKLHDLHMLDLKSLTWLPLNYKGAGPSPRSNHVAALYDDRILLIFGGQSKSKTLNDVHALDFETMVWSRVKTHGHHPSPRAGCCGALCGTKWYIAGGGSKKKRHPETWVFDVLESKWSVCVVPPSSSITTKKGFSMVPLYYRDKIVLVSFGGNKKEPSDKVEVLVVLQNEHCFSWRSAPDAEPLMYEDSPPSSKELADHLNNCEPVNSVARHSLATTVESSSGRKSIPDSLLQNSNLGSSSLRRQFRQEEECSLAQKLQKPIDDDKYKDVDDCSELPSFANQKQRSDTYHSPDADAKAKRLGRSSSDINHQHDTKIANLARRNMALEEKVSAAMASKDEAEKNLSLVIDSKEELEKRLAERDREVEMLKEKVIGLELAQEDSNSASNTVHADNVRLEREVAFLKAVMDENQKELHSTRGVLAGERARAFQLQVEVFHLKQRLQTMDGRSPTPRKPQNI
ncbi:acyl-CoA-binding domain-containing protein 6-like [Lolium rigidum]|uniref:acyl-CoA-binding domain-containing protein 6-like n=1 Tax=Lolium rigidum TaxID=89674 RepID=UPI001F5C94A7|nr:acyl-CoA-binding domain-containing protein 6-like [Lolium rigidum]XP_051180317.1 acyl-CoA-binding domain-containing protein 6-like [Lolium perenne]